MAWSGKRDAFPRWRITSLGSRWLALVALLSAALIAGCTMIGPDYVRPPAPTADEWIEDDPRIESEAADYSDWWTVFDDPVLDSLVETAYEQNLSLRVAGIRVLEAQARRGIAIGGIFPQQQQASGAYARVETSGNRANQGNPVLTQTFDDWQVGFDAAWELDLWGRFRRGIEAADADLIASVANYDDVLVSLIAEVAATYVQIRTLQEQLAVAQSNVEIQQRSFEIAEAKFRNGMVTELDVAQARSLLRGTEARVPALEASVRQSQNSLCILLGIPPRDLQEMLQGSQPIPTAPGEVAVGISADLLRRRPDIRQAERAVAAQSAEIGIALADLYPSFSLVGTISLAAEDVDDLFEGDSFEGFGGPTFHWAILNYGRIRNNVRVQDARFQQLVVAYENTVLRAQQEVENAIASFLGAQDEVEFLADGVDASQRAVRLANLQYREGDVEYTRVLNTQQALLADQERLVTRQGSVALNLIALYKALGGGWELRSGNDFVPEKTKEQMRERTNWGGLLSPEEQAGDVEAASSGTEKDQRWWRWRWWWPKW